MIVIIDYGMGNLNSIKNMLRKIGIPATISSNTDVIRSADKLILPGVGAFDNGMKNLKDMGLIEVLNEIVLNHKTPILGICLGMQLMTLSSEEGILPGLGWINGNTERFKQQELLPHRIPNIGWNTLSINQPHPLLKEINSVQLNCIGRSKWLQWLEVIALIEIVANVRIQSGYPGINNSILLYG
jgi:glutamine amidotransferase